MFIDIHHRLPHPTKQEISQAGPQDDGDTHVGIVGHESQHEEVAHEHLEHVEETLADVVWVYHADTETKHYDDVIMSAMASEITSLAIFCLLKRLFQAWIKGNIKDHCSLWGEFTGDRWIPRTRGQ